MLNNIFIYNLSQLYLSGALHGDERLGPNVLKELAEILVENYDKHYMITNLMNNYLIVLTPMTNAWGYYYNNRVRRILI